MGRVLHTGNHSLQFTGSRKVHGEHGVALTLNADGLNHLAQASFPIFLHFDARPNLSIVILNEGI